MTEKIESRRAKERFFVRGRSFRPRAGLYFVDAGHPSVETLGYSHPSQSPKHTGMDKAMSDGY